MDRRRGPRPPSMWTEDEPTIKKISTNPLPRPSRTRQCGDDHTDPVFDVTRSTSYHALDCAECQFSGHCKDAKCSISLSYAEGSRWDAYEVSWSLVYTYVCVGMHACTYIHTHV